MRVYANSGNFKDFWDNTSLLLSGLIDTLARPIAPSSMNSDFANYQEKTCIYHQYKKGR